MKPSEKIRENRDKRKESEDFDDIDNLFGHESKLVKAIIQYLDESQEPKDLEEKPIRKGIKDCQTLEEAQELAMDLKCHCHQSEGIEWEEKQTLARDCIVSHTRFFLDVEPTPDFVNVLLGDIDTLVKQAITTALARERRNLRSRWRR